MSIGGNIKSFRLENQLTQEEFAKMVGVHRSMITQIERGTKVPTMPLGQAIAKALGCTINDLFENSLQQTVKQ